MTIKETITDCDDHKMQFVVMITLCDHHKMTMIVTITHRDEHKMTLVVTITLCDHLRNRCPEGVEDTMKTHQANYLDPHWIPVV
jgi:hypothetical protein